MNSKSKTFTLHSSSSLSNIFKRNVPSLNKTVTTKLQRAQQKLLEIISDVMHTAKNNNSARYLTLEQYKSAVWAAKTLNEVDLVLRHSKSKKYLEENFKTQFNFGSAKVKVNKYGKIFVDTAILVQLMDLHNVLGKMMEHLKEASSKGRSELFVSDTEGSADSIADRKFNELLADLETRSESTKSTKEILTALSLPLNNEFLVMPAEIDKKSRSVEEQNDSEETRRTKSSSSFKHEVTDAAGARRIIIRCLSDLDKVKNYLHSIDQDNDFQSTRAEEPTTDEESRLADVEEQEEEAKLEKAPSKTLTQEQSRSGVEEKNKSRENIPPVSKTNDSEKKCCCAEDCPADEPLEFTWKEGDEASSKLVICIKGKTEEDGDVHVVIRQCPDCQLVGKDKSSKLPPSKESSRAEVKGKNYESDILHGKDPEADCTLSTSDNAPGSTSKTDINVIFDPQDPSKSRVERRRSSQQRLRYAKAEEKISKIELNETVNLNLETDQGQDLVISLTVRPKIGVGGPMNKLSITDIFSDSRTDMPERDKRKGFQEAERGPSERAVNETRSRSKPSSREDTTIPLSRTKICSSLEFDVQVVESRMKSSGINHNNPNIVVRLNDMGVNNLLRACRPVKCGRKAILNESLRKCLPYSPSLGSLPLEEHDADIIDQSLSMSVKRSKHSTVFVKKERQVYFVQVSGVPPWIDSLLKYYVSLGKEESSSPNPKSCYESSKNVKKSLGYYINLVNDEAPHWSAVEVRYFEIENIQKRKDDKVPATILRVRLKRNESVHEEKAKQAELQKVESTAKVANKRSKCPSRIPVSKYRYSQCKKARSKVSQPLELLALKENTKGADFESRKPRTARAVGEGNKYTSPVVQLRSKSVLTIRSKDATTNSSNSRILSVETADYFSRFMKYISLLDSAPSSTKSQQVKKGEFLTSRSHSRILDDGKKDKKCMDKDVTPSKKSPNKKYPEKRSPDTDAVLEKGIKLNDVVLSSTRFKKQLDHKKTPSRIVVNRLSNFLYENFVEDVSDKTRKELLYKVDQLLSVHSDRQSKNKATLRGRRNAQ